MSDNVYQFDQWIRSRFIDINTQLEDIYFKQADRTMVDGSGEALKNELLKQGERFLTALVDEGNTDQGFDSAFDLLGNVGLFMAACRRHELSHPDKETRSPLKNASALAMHIGASIGVTPRFATAHLTTHNTAINGEYKRFTHLADERCFIDFNTLGILAFKRAADALLKILPLGISHPMVPELFRVAKRALHDVLDSNAHLYAQLDTERFFYSVRPYYKPYRVGNEVYRGANAGDFAEINVLDMLLGVCSANDPAYSQMLVDKFLFMMPADQKMLRDCMRRTSLMDEFLSHQHFQSQSWFQNSLTGFIEVCEVYGKTAIQHHEQLVKKFIQLPAKQLDNLDSLTASGPPLERLLAGLDKLKDKRAAAQRDDIATRYQDIIHLKSLVDEQVGIKSEY